MFTSEFQPSPSASTSGISHSSSCRLYPFRKHLAEILDDDDDEDYNYDDDDYNYDDDGDSKNWNKPVCRQYL